MILLVLSLACAPDPVLVDLSLADAVSTVVLVEPAEDTAPWTSARVEYGAHGALDRSLSFDLSQDPVPPLALVGFKPGADVRVRVVVDEGGRTRESEEQTITTGPAPSWLPTVQVDVDDGGEHVLGDYVVTSVVTSPPTAVLLDRDGDFVWWAELEGALQVGRVRLARDGRGVLAMPINVEGESERGLIRVDWDGTDQGDVVVPGAHHDFVELADGTLGLLSEEEREVGEDILAGDLVVEQAPDGTQTTIWNAWDDLDPATTPSGLLPPDWTHANVLVYDQQRDDWLVSLMGTRAIARVGRDGSGLRWLFGGEVGDFQDASGETDLIARQHVFELVDGGLVLFENGMPDAPVSRAVQWSLDEEQLRAEEVWSYTPDPSLWCFSLGGLDRLENGDTLVTFSVNGRIDEVDAAGNLRWRLSASLGGTFGYSEVVKLPGQP
ncbi:aryl-sulfate sulfotransferase [Myxococcota bacterium]|nr:aryl-sulfate sulfotransferase [Myxococcota bacterium]